MNSHAATALHRKNEIVGLVRERTIRSQDELQRLLAARGIVVTQPTLSRDVRDLELVKSPAGYALPGRGPTGQVPGRQAGTLHRLLREFAMSVERAGTLVVVKTPPAAAHAVALAIDQSALPDVVGTIAGDDTIFLAAHSESAAARLARELAAPIGPDRSRRPSTTPRPRA